MSGEKTEKPTPKRLRDARKEGQIPRTQDLGTWAGVLAAAVLLRLGLPYAFDRIQALFVRATTLIQDPQMPAALALLRSSLNIMLVILGPFVGTLMLVGILCAISQGGFNIATKAAKPSVKRMNPISGLKRMFGPHSAWELGKSLTKSAVIGWTVYTAVRKVAPVLVGASAMPLVTSLGIIADAAFVLMRNAAACGLIMGAMDYLVQRHRTGKKLKMSHQDIKEEHKRSEGDPHVKGQIRSRQLAMSRNRMMQSVADADVVLVNPTHVAVALKYDPAKGAPRVIAKGAGAVAARIREKAEEHRVPMVQDVPLARAIYKACDLGQEVPPDLYAAVAKVLAFILSLKARGSAAGVHRVVPLPRARPRAGAGR